MGTSDIALERVQALLKTDTGSGSLHDHLIRVVRKLTEDRPNDALAQLEALSRHLKQSTFKGNGAPDETQDIVVDAAMEEARQRFCGDIVQLVRPPSDPKVLGAVRNFNEDAAMLEWAGIGFGKQESFHIAMSLRRLAAEAPALERLRLWGKVLGTGGDYYIAEGCFESPPAPPAGANPPIPPLPGTPEYDVEPRGEGGNIFTYWASQGPCLPWVRLPNIRASQILAARKIKRMMTGNLESQVISMPWFPGKELHLLRAQIARIAATCSLAVSGFYEADPDDESGKKIKEVEEFAFPGHDDLVSQANWVHMAPHLLQACGKSTWPDPEAYGEALSEQQREDLGTQREAEPQHGRLEGIEADLAELKPEGSEVEGSIAWNIKVFGDKGIYAAGDATTSHRVTAVRSLIWPGAVSVAQGKKFANIYVGYGLKCGTLVPRNPQNGLQLPGTNPFEPLVPDDICDEPKDQEEQDEPNPQEDEAESDKGSVDADEA